MNVITEATSATNSQANDFLKLRLASGDVPDVWQNFDIPSFADASQLYAFFNSVQPQSCVFYNKAMFQPAVILTTLSAIARSFSLWLTRRSVLPLSRSATAVRTVSAVSESRLSVGSSSM